MSRVHANILYCAETPLWKHSGVAIQGQGLTYLTRYNKKLQVEGKKKKKTT